MAFYSLGAFCTAGVASWVFVLWLLCTYYKTYGGLSLGGCVYYDSGGLAILLTGYLVVDEHDLYCIACENGRKCVWHRNIDTLRDR